MKMNRLHGLFLQADATDRREGAMAYRRYHDLLKRIAEHYGFPFPATVATFVALSPNSDYFGNLRSLVSVMQGVKAGRPCEQITVSTYKHCRDRAHSYLTGERAFLDHAKGLKTRAFYTNIVDPEHDQAVVIDGHIHAAWAGENWTMKEAAISRWRYLEVARDIKVLAFQYQMMPHEMQATLWFARKRINQIKYFSQLDLFHAGDDQWRTLPAIRDILPYGIAA